MGYKLRWSEESVQNLDDIIDDIYGKWSEKEVQQFKKKLANLLELIISNPLLFLASIQYPDLRKAVLSKQTTVFYKIEKDRVYVSYIHLNKRDQGRIR